jgi:hypothetical protein
MISVLPLRSFLRPDNPFKGLLRSSVTVRPEPDGPGATNFPREEDVTPMKALTRPRRIMVVFVTLFCCLSVIAFAQLTDADGLMVDIPEPPEAGMELPTPVPMVYEFMNGVMQGNYDACLANFDVNTFLLLQFGRSVQRLGQAEMRELYAFQVQAQRNEFRFLSRVMNRVAPGAKINFSNPRYHKKVQSKIVVYLSTHKGKYEFEVYCRYSDDRWLVYDYVLNKRRFSQSFKEGLAGMRIDNYIASLRPFYEERGGLRTIDSPEFGIRLRVPSHFEVREKVSPALLASISGFDGQLLGHVQAAVYQQPQTLKQVAAEIKQTIMPFNPRLYDQWKTDIAGVDIGHVLFHFDKNDKRLYTHMIIIPMREKLVVLNFYHSSLQLMKHLTNLRERVFDSLNLTKIEAAGGELMIPADDLSLPSDNVATDLEPYAEPSHGNVSTDAPMTPGSVDDDLPPPPTYDDPGDDDEIPPPPPDDPSMLAPNTYGEGDEIPPPPDYPEPPPPPPMDDPADPPPGDPADPPPGDDSDYSYPSTTDDGEVSF